MLARMWGNGQNPAHNWGCRRVGHTEPPGGLATPLPGIHPEESKAATEETSVHLGSQRW